VDFEYDVVFYLAHPEDETLFTPGTMETLVVAKKRVFDVVLSHGEGGRLLDVNAAGDVKESTAAPEKVAVVRDREFAKVMETLGVRYEHLYPASARADFAAKDVRGHARAVHGCDETMKRWQELLPDGIAGAMRKLVESIRNRRPRIVVTHDPRDDEDWLDHGHHKALGALVHIAVRLAADPRLAGERPHVVEELVTIAPKQVRADVTLHVKTDIRRRVMAKNISQFEPKKFAEVAQRTDERYVIAWRAQGAASPPGGGSLLGSFLKSR
jgi:LmbE family N-acetylglucosaminyl deacetylase